MFFKTKCKKKPTQYQINWIFMHIFYKGIYHKLLLDKKKTKYDRFLFSATSLKICAGKVDLDWLKYCTGIILYMILL